MRMRLPYAVLMVVIGFLLASPASAADRLDLLTGLKTLPLLTNKITSALTMAIIFNPANAESKAEADEIKALVDSGWEIPGAGKLTAIMVPTSDLSKLAEAKIAFVTKNGCTDAVGAAATANGLLTMSTDIDCVESGKCVLGIVTKPRVEIYYSKAAADAAKISFSPTFLMLVKQV